MLKGIYSAASGMTSQMMLTDVTANNLANINTPGFKGVGVEFKSFADIMVRRLGNMENQELGTFAQGSEVLASFTNFTQGDLVPTGNPLDLALKGDGFFAIKQNGTNTLLYTRSGNFTLDDKGFLTTLAGDRVQGLQGDIQIPRGTSKIEISPIGEVIANNQAIDRLALVQFEDNQALKRIGTNNYQAVGQTPNPAAGLTVEQGALEQANTNVITEMVNSMTGLRIYEMLQKSIQMQNETLGKTVNDVGRVT